MIPPHFAWVPLGILAAALAVIGIRARRNRKPRPVPGLPEDGKPLECWEWDEMNRIQAFYAATADEPVPGRTWWWS